MPDDTSALTKNTWRFRGNPEPKEEPRTMIRGALTFLMSNLNKSDNRPVIPMSITEPSAFECFKTTQVATQAVTDVVRSNKFNGYASPSVGILPARRAVAEHLSKDLPDKLSPDNVFLTLGCRQAMHCILHALGGSKSNILIPKPYFPYYDYFPELHNFEVRFFNLLPEKNWEIDIDSLRAAADENTVAMIITNPGNPCANVFTYRHLEKVAETAKTLGILVISDEVYAHIVFGESPFVPMGVFASITPVVTIGSISKRWLVPGWRMGWVVTHDPNGILKEHGIPQSMKRFLDISPNPPTIIQAALPDILANTKDDFFSKTLNIIKEDANSFYEGIKHVPGMTCPTKPEGSMSTMVKLDLSVFEDIEDDMNFCLKLAKEESVIILPGVSVGLSNWLRITFAIDPLFLEDGMKRLKDFCERHSKKM
ncbi:probable aminotransferase TAT2 [Rutidosis leptorrhynchoides]|uniref:probable aminotransferase TAT2 n=1 Tax=Rutidosis leptorrhynchoides TaxID=125765 RepID=UPI003A9A40CE